jgi:hypothetical protein
MLLALQCKSPLFKLAFLRLKPVGINSHEVAYEAN